MTEEKDPIPIKQLTDIHWPRQGREHYIMSLEQEPEHAKACSTTDKECKPVDPPPIVKLRVDDGDPTYKYVSSPHFFMFAELEVVRQNNSKASSDSQSQPPSKLLSGNLAATNNRLRDDKGDVINAAYFLFPQIYVSTAGWYKLNFSLYENRQVMQSQSSANEPSNSLAWVCLQSITSKPFQVLDAKDYKPAPSTPLTISFMEQGYKALKGRGDSRAVKRRRMIYQPFSYPQTPNHGYTQPFLDNHRQTVPQGHEVFQQEYHGLPETREYQDFSHPREYSHGGRSRAQKVLEHMAESRRKGGVEEAKRPYDHQKEAYYTEKYGGTTQGTQNLDIDLRPRFPSAILAEPVPSHQNHYTGPPTRLLQGEGDSHVDYSIDKERQRVIRNEPELARTLPPLASVPGQPYTINPPYSHSPSPPRTGAYGQNAHSSSSSDVGHSPPTTMQPPAETVGSYGHRLSQGSSLDAYRHSRPSSSSSSNLQHGSVPLYQKDTPRALPRLSLPSIDQLSRPDAAFELSGLTAPTYTGRR